MQVIEGRGQDVNELTLITALDAIRRNDTERGLARLRKVLDESSTNPSDLLLLGRMYILAGRLQDADRPLKRALELAPGSPDAWQSYIDLLARTNRKSQALTLVAEAGKKLPANVAPLVQARARSPGRQGRGREKLPGRRGPSARRSRRAPLRRRVLLQA